MVFNFNFHETKLKEVQDKSKAGLIATAAFSGLPSDRNAEVMIRKGIVIKEKMSKEEKQAARIIAKNMKQTEKANKKAEKKALKEAKKKAKQKD